MIRSFKDQKTQDIFNGVNSKMSRKIPKELHKIARRKLDYLNSAKKLEDLSLPPNNRLHSLKNNLSGYYAISVNDQYRIIFRWHELNAEDVLIDDYH